MSSLSELLPTGGGQNAVDFVASGTLSSGQTVVLNSDGTVSAVAGSSQSVGSAVVFESAQTEDTSSVFDSNSNKIVIAYRDSANSSYGTAVVGTVSGTSISFGTPVVFESGYVFYTSAVFDSNSNKIVVAYRDVGNSSYGTAVVGTVSGTSISFGSPVLFQGSGRVFYVSAAFDSNANKVVIAYSDDINADYGTAIVGTVSGTSISFGSSAVFASAATYFTTTTFDSNSNKIVIAYTDLTNSYAVVGTVSGTSISFGTAAQFESARTDDKGITFDSSANKVVIAYEKDVSGGASNIGVAVVGTVSGTSISFGTPVTFEPGSSVAYVTCTYDSSANGVVVSYRDGSNSNYGTLIVGTVSGTSISFGANLVFNSATSSFISSAYDSNASKVVIAYQDLGNSSYGTSIVFQPGSTNSADFIGITAGAISDTATGTVNVRGGINEAQTGLTIGSDYYVQDDGSLSTTASDVKAGQAISATTINMMDLT